MPRSKEKNKLSEEVAKIDAQMAALAKLKKKHLAKISASTSPENQMSHEEWEEKLVDAFAEAFVYLGQNGMLQLKEDTVPVTTGTSLQEKTPILKSKNGFDEKFAFGGACVARTTRTKNELRMKLPKTPAVVCF